MALPFRQLALCVVSMVAYSTGLRIGRRLAEISADWTGARSPGEMTMSTAKAELMDLLDQLPDDCTPEQIEYTLRVRNSIRRGIETMEQGRVVTHEEARWRFRRWLTDSAPGHQTNVDTELRWALDEMITCSPKAEILAALDELPDDCTLDDLRDQLHEREQIRQGLASALNEPRVSQEEVEAWIDRWERE